MIEWYCRKITEGKITIGDVPPKWREQVRERFSA